MSPERFFPTEEYLGKNCYFWDIGRVAMTCAYPKNEMEGRRSCEGIIDDVCLFLKNGRPPSSLSQHQIDAIRQHPPNIHDKSYLPPGDTT